MGHGQASNPFNQVSSAHWLGDSAIGKAFPGSPTENKAPLNPQGYDKQTGQQIMGGSSNTNGYNQTYSNAPQFGGLFTTPPISATSNNGGNGNYSAGAGNQYGGANAEQNFLTSYQNALNPNTNYNINAQTNPLTSQAGFKSPTVAGALSNNAGGK